MRAPDSRDGLSSAEAILQHIRGNYLICRELPGALDLNWRFVRVDGKQTSQVARVQVIDANGEAWIRVTAPVRPRTLVDAAWALERNAMLILGCLAVSEGSVVVTTTFPPRISPADLRLALELVPREAAQLREGRLSPGHSPAMFDEYAQ